MEVEEGPKFRHNHRHLPDTGLWTFATQNQLCAREGVLIKHVDWLESDHCITIAASNEG